MKFIVDLENVRLVSNMFKIDEKVVMDYIEKGAKDIFEKVERPTILTKNQVIEIVNKYK